MPEIIELEILEFEKYNPRKDLKSTSWFRLQNSIFEDPQLFCLSHEELCFWIYIMCQASKKQSAQVSIHMAHANRVGRFESNTIYSALEKLQTLQCVRTRNVDVTQTLRAVALRTEQDVTNTTKQDVTDGLYARSSKLLQADPVYPKNYLSIHPILLGRKVTQKLSETWEVAFPDSDWVVQQINKAIAWEAANPKRMKKDFGKFMTNWMNKGWDERRHAPTKTNQAEQRFDGTKDALNRALEKIGAQKV